MTTTIVYRIKPGGTPGTDCEYTSLNTFEAGERANLTTGGIDTIKVAEVYGTGNCLSGAGMVNFSSSWVMDSTHYVEIIAAAGHEHTGVWNTGKAYGLNATERCIYSANSDDYIHLTKMQFKGYNQPISSYANVTIDRCIIQQDYAAVPAGSCVRVDGGTAIVRNSILICGAFGVGTMDTPAVASVYNCTIIGLGHGGYWMVGGWAGSCTSQNNYIYHIDGSDCYSAPSYVTKGTNDATYNAEAVTANLRSIPYSTATFLNVTPGSENLHLTVSAGNKLINNGANLSGQGVTVDIIGTARPQAGAYDIGAFENDIPICWNYTARYKNSNKLFKASGCGPFPKTLQVPSNIDTSTGKMIDDGVFISPDKYEII